MHTVFLDASDDVLAAEMERDGHTTMTLGEAQALIPEITQRIAGGPDRMRIKADGDPRGFHHQKTSGDGTQAGHYSEIAWDTLLRLTDYVAQDDLSRDHRTIDYQNSLTQKLYSYIDQSDTNFWYRGEIRRVQFFADSARTILVVQQDRNFVRHADGTLVVVNSSADYGDGDWFGRRLIHTVYKKNGAAHPVTKTCYKLYDDDWSMEEGKSRRGRVVNFVKSQAYRMLIAVTAADPNNPTPEECAAAEATLTTYMTKYMDDINLYTETSNLAFTGRYASPPTPNITEDVESFLDENVTAFGWTGPTIRDEMLSQLKGILE